MISAIRILSLGHGLLGLTAGLDSQIVLYTVTRHRSTHSNWDMDKSATACTWNNSVVRARTVEELDGAGCEKEQKKSASLRAAGNTNGAAAGSTWASRHHRSQHQREHQHRHVHVLARTNDHNDCHLTDWLLAASTGDGSLLGSNVHEVSIVRRVSSRRRRGCTVLRVVKQLLGERHLSG